MRRLPLSAIPLLVAVCFALPARAATIPNAGFEQKNADGQELPSDWAPDQWGGVQATFLWTTDGHAGRGARVDVSQTGTEGDAKWLGVDFAADTGATTYIVGDWYRANVATELILNTIDANGNNGYVFGASLPAAAAWTHAEVTVHVPLGTKRLRVLHVIQAVGFLETDDVTCVGTDAVAPGGKKYKATVSFTFDDGWVSAYNMLIPRLDKKGWPATHFIITTYPDKPGYQSDYILSSHIKSLVARGHEVGSHTMTHPNLVELAQGDWQAQLHDPVAMLKGWGAPALGVAPPYGSYTPAIRDYAKTQYAYLRRLNPEVNTPPYNLFELNGYVLTNTSKPSELDELLTRAEQVEGGWVILVFHRAGPVLPADMPGVEAYVRPLDFQEFIGVVEKHGASVETVGQHLAMFKPVVLPPEPTLVLGDKELEPPEVATPATQAGTDVDVQPGEACQASPQTPILGAWPAVWLLGLFGVALLTVRRVARKS